MRRPYRSILGLVLATSACTSNKPAEPTTVAVAPTPAIPATPPTPPTPATPATPATAPAAPPAPTPDVPGEPATTLTRNDPCDPTGVWRLKLITDGSCGTKEDEVLNVALALGERSTLLSAARSADSAAATAGLVPALRAMRADAPGSACGVRLELRPGSGPTHVELLLKREPTGLNGLGTLWSTQDGKSCRTMFSVFGERIARPEPWAQLTPVGKFVPLPRVKRASSELARAARKIEAQVIPIGVSADPPRIALKGSVVDYVAAVLDQPGSVKLYEVACTAATGPDARCVAVVGDPCAPGGFEGEDCEGMYLTMVVDTKSGKLDRADAGGYPVESQADIEERLESAP